MMSAQKDYIGRVLAGRAGLVAPDRPALVGVKPVRADVRLTSGAHFLRLGAEASLANDEGFVSSVAFSPTLGQWIGLGFLTGGPKRVGERIRAHDPLSGGEVDVEVEVTNAVFYDPDGKRLRS
jgi:sarcosine oxidase subunit alpha